MTDELITPKELGRRGGMATLQNKGVEHFKRISQLAAKKRIKNRDKKIGIV